ncbi:hypothetical protein HMPREF9419_1728 [Prevotella nigrescens ATCC 33563]|nr:hypothetical protein HMPREF9419_1728 [Prevotella nigrescens ATCC 33563]
MIIKSSRTILRSSRTFFYLLANKLLNGPPTSVEIGNLPSN